MADPVINEWDPLCGCIIRFQFDPDEPAGRRKHTAVDHPGRKRCARHDHADHHAHYQALRMEHHARATAADPNHGWRLVVEEDGGIRDVRG